jgi:uncharacterized membrane protein YdjX (TVP38/TMEM64 family)
LVPVLPFDGVSYGAGLIKLPVKVYAGATLLGMVPSICLLTYAGQSLTTTLPEKVAIFAVLLIGLVGLPWAAHRHNWFGLQDLIRSE